MCTDDMILNAVKYAMSNHRTDNEDLAKVSRLAAMGTAGLFVAQTPAEASEVIFQLILREQPCRDGAKKAVKALLPKGQGWWKKMKKELKAKGLWDD